MCQESSPDSFRLTAALCGGSLSAPPWQPLIEASLPVAKGWDVLEQKNPGDPSLSVPLPVPTHPGRLSEQPKCMHGLCCFCRSLSVSTSSSSETSSTAAGLNWTRSALAVFSGDDGIFGSHRIPVRKGHQIQLELGHFRARSCPFLPFID